MLGLGVGSIFGGIFSSKAPFRLPQLFLMFEVMIGLFGLVSLPLIKSMGTLTLHGSLLTISLTTYVLLSIPTFLMGATLPILVTYLHLHYRNAGKAVGTLYGINTLGSAVACFVTTDVLFTFFGLQYSVFIAAFFNFTVGILVYRFTRRMSTKSPGWLVADAVPLNANQDRA
jgi:predicted membrane-bound spermidine synthase